MKKGLTIAGSDPSGGAGIQADLKTFLAHNVYGMSVITAVTAQNTTGVFAIEDLSEEIVGKQLDAVLSDIYPDAVKIGMVSSKELIKLIAEKLKEYHVSNIVLDTVMVSTSGHSLLRPEAKEVLIHELLPLANLITPNIPEAQEIAGITIYNKEDMVRAAEIISRKTNAYVLVKGGHLKDCSDDLLYKDGNEKWFFMERIKVENSHGTGCTLSSAIAANLACNKSMEEAVGLAKEYLTGALIDGLDLGRGNGPINHGWNL
ncbi:bifunctional hydroxymethylpyrimidine kinase/phosphomethylpyrimidine kinase [Anaerosacchariphilus polymeriproducens]|uniref:Hydroxymethylpyrimidine/phosphomethylpyrimidine kinase n=1 Tax=Anaerosacchariphilus polymeriproducens TaxID=1812858 RepID=A0A371ASR0_9FIRM|nr:bifunctional hydroxymethylpyrimidine kinase/phosphomethylpyrimidine kinase [Anaerosacchariphilus polymeriproducens]RDU22613.1 bifunctional hydroxymethylpyrimidine kinase/phosphomethylpyrimidine kinase [Anaerosacchariphilus polymeriproducens]